MTELHPSVQEKLDWFDPEHFGSDLKWVVGYCRDLAFIMSAIPSHPQLTLGLQHLIEAQECFVKAVKAGQKADTELKKMEMSTDFPGTPRGRGDTVTIVEDEMPSPHGVQLRGDGQSRGYPRPGRPVRDNPQA